MTARETFERLFKAIGDYARATNNDYAARKIDHARELLEPGSPASVIAHGAMTPNEARTVFRSHPDGRGFTIDGSLRPGQPTREGDEDNGAFIGLRSGHALQSVKDWAKRRGFPDETIAKFDRLDDLLDWIHDPAGMRDA